MRKGYRECYPLGYRLSSGTALTEPKPYDENYMALVISIITGKTSAQSLSIMGLTPEENGTHIARATYKWPKQCICFTDAAICL